MNILIDVGHTPQLNFYKNLIHTLAERGEHIYVVVLKRGRLLQIAQYELGNIPNVEVVPIGRHRMNKWSAVFEANLLRMLQLLWWSLGKKIDVVLSNGALAHIVGWFHRASGFAFGDDPQVWDYRPKLFFCAQSAYCIYESQKPLSPKAKILPCLKEWAYLAPNVFKHDIAALSEYGVQPEQYLFLREVSVGTINYAGQASGAVLGIVPEIQKMQAEYPSLKVLLSLEEKHRRAEYPADWILLQEPVKDIHSLIYYSAGLISSGDSMAREAALLGVPAYYLGIRYDMPANAAAAKVAQLQNQKTQSVADWLHDILSVDIQTAEEKQQQLRNHIDKEFIDINHYMLGIVEGVADSTCAKNSQFGLKE